MQGVTKLMINDFGIRKLGYDFMGYKVDKKSSLSFHHLIIPKRDCRKYGLGDGYEYWNGAILVQDTSHEYLHVIEQYDKKRFEEITLQMIYQKMKGHLDKENLIAIRELLLEFEANYTGLCSAKGKQLIKDDYISGRLVNYQ